MRTIREWEMYCASKRGGILETERALIDDLSVTRNARAVEAEAREMWYQRHCALQKEYDRVCERLVCAEEGARIAAGRLADSCGAVPEYPEVAAELARATTANGPFNSAHEGYAVLLEEVQELWEHVRRKRADRKLEEMRKEAVHVAAMAIRFMRDVCELDSAPLETVNA